MHMRLQGAVQAPGVLLGPEHQDLTFGRLVGLLAFEYLLAVVKNIGGRVQDQRLVGLDARAVPSPCRE